MKIEQVTLPNGIIYKGVSTEGEWKDRVSGNYETESIKFLQEHIDEVDTFIDVGAFCGYFGLHACNEIDTHVIFVEPNAQCAKTIQESLELNNFRDIVIRNVAISNKHGTQLFSHGKIAGFYRGKNQNGSEEVKVIQLNELLGYNVIHAMIKIDVEGMEREVIQGIQPYQDRVEHCIVEFHPMHADADDITLALSLLKKYGLKEVWRSGDPYTTNANLHFSRI